MREYQYALLWYNIHYNYHKNKHNKLKISEHKIFITHCLLLFDKLT